MNKVIHMTILGQRIQALLNEKHLTQKQLSLNLNMAASTISGYIRGAREPDFASLDAIARYFNVSVDYLLGRTDLRQNTLTKSEQELLTLYRALTTEQQAFVVEQLRKKIGYQF